MDNKKLVDLYYAGVKFRDMAAALGVAQQTVANRIHYLRRRGVKLPERKARTSIEELRAYANAVSKRSR